ncbi:MAG TPA: hypothetical protein EYO33_16865 [Phycisphaerales bacterium]|nr:hypothetical protein [Phycisphaerales bacterium]
MKVDSKGFQELFLHKARQALKELESPQEQVVALPSDTVQLSQGGSHLNFSSMVLALSAAAPAGGIPLLAALSQETAQALITPEQEKLHSERMRAQFQDVPKVDDSRVSRFWEDVSAITKSPFPAPEVFQSSFFDASSDVETMSFGTTMLESELKDDAALAFTIAHEEGHRQHRDTQGAKGLELFADLCLSNDELSSIGIQVLFEGRKQNEREADEFAARVLSQMDIEKDQVLTFLSAFPEDNLHPAGSERAALVASAWT